MSLTKVHPNSPSETFLKMNFFGANFPRPKHLPTDLFQTSVNSMKEGILRNGYNHQISTSLDFSIQCIHEIVEGWKLSQCASCGLDLGVTRMEEEERHGALAKEEDRVLAEVRPHVDHLHSLGIRVDALIAFAHDHDCWETPTWMVVRDIIVPATRKHGRCRYGDLPEHKKCFGPATVFISHCWGSKFGDLVGAAAHGARLDRIVWIDIFAVRQFPGNVADLNFRGVMGKCVAAIVSVSAVQGLGDVLSNQSEIKAFSASPEGQSAKKTLPTCRLWCLVEIFAAMQLNIPLVVKGGSLVVNATQDKDKEQQQGEEKKDEGLGGSVVMFSKGEFSFKSRPWSEEETEMLERGVALSPVHMGNAAGQSINWARVAEKLGTGRLAMQCCKEYQRICVKEEEEEEDGKKNENSSNYFYDTECTGELMTNLSQMIDVASAECAVQADYDREIALVNAAEGGAEHVNTVVQGVVIGAQYSSGYNIVEIDAAVCGELNALQSLRMESGSTGEERELARKVLLVAATGGRVNIVRELLMQWQGVVGGGEEEEAEEDDYTENQKNKEEKEKEKERRKVWLHEIIKESHVVWSVASGGHAEVLKTMLNCVEGMDVNDVNDDNGATALAIACQNGHHKVVDLLLKTPSLDINLRKDPNPNTPLLIACFTRQPTMVERLLCAPEIDVNLLSKSSGHTAVHLASHFGWVDVVRRLLEKPNIDLNILSYDNSCPLGLAQKKNHQEIVKLLTEAGALDVSEIIRRKRAAK